MSELLERQISEYLRGERTPAEDRKLAEAALADENLFDALAAHGAVEQALQSPELRATLAASTNVTRFPRKTWGLALAAIAAGIVGFALYIGSRSQPAHAPAVATQSAPTPASSPSLIAKDFAAGADQTVFRSAPSDSRAPQAEGSISAIDNFSVTINLGSLDGLNQGTQLEVYAAGSNQATGRLEATTIFRDHARARIVSGSSIHEHDRVRANPSVYLRAVLDVMASNRKLGHDALKWAASAGATPSDERAILDRLAPLDYKAGDARAAEQDYQALLASAATPSDRAEALNNLGAIAELRGDPNAARRLYQDALNAVDNTRDRQIIEANLARLTGGAGDKR